MYAKYFKRILDFVLAMVLFIITLPISLIVGILVRINLGSPIIFKQKRPGKNEKEFTLYKFRTMTDKRDDKGELLPDDERLTKFGLFLRSTSLDELPELINIIKGDMSFVGPRPLLTEYLELYNEKQKHRHDVRPGLTGLAQVNGRNLLEWEKRFDYDIEYVNNVSFKEDVKIVFKTISLVLSRKGISSSNSKTMEKFTGSKMNTDEKK